MSEKGSTIGSTAGIAALAGLCCGLPLLASVGVLGAIAGIGLGSWVVIAAATLVIVAGVVRWRRNANSCDTRADIERPQKSMHPSASSNEKFD